MQKRKLKKGSPRWEMFGEIEPKLGLIFFDLCCLLERHGIDNIIITSIIRPKINDSGVHALGRAMDISLETIPDHMLYMINTYMNEKWIYDPNRKHLNTCVIHTGDGYDNDIAPHIHLQVL